MAWRIMGAEVRRLHIIYILSRNGCNQHPHLLRIHHLSRNGVRLKDIKRWLGEVRGKDMPELFSWSFKRRYKTGYVWQDLLDVDLVTPISDNEYILKGCLIDNTCKLEFSKTPVQKDPSSPRKSARDSQEASSKLFSSSDSSMHLSPKASSEIGESEASTLTDSHSGKDELEKNSDTLSQEAKSSNKEKKSWTSISTTAESSDKTRLRKSHSGGIFRNLISCRNADTNDSAVVITNKRSRPFLNTCLSHSAVGVKKPAKEKGQCREERATYRPLYGPNCSQCGKKFRPEKLHAHMKSCKGMRAKAKGGNAALSAAENDSEISTASRNKDSVSVYLLNR